MRLGKDEFARVALIAVCLAVGAATTMPAQGRGGGGPPGGGGPGGGGGMGGPQFPGGGPGAPGGPGGPGPGGPGQAGGPPPQGQRGQPAENRLGMQFGPPGRWWDDRATAKSLRLTPEQQTRMDAIFEQNRGALQARYDGLQQAELQLDELSKSPAPDEAALDAQIDRVAHARAELEKANTHLLLQIRREMDAEQIKRLEKMH